MTTFETIIFTIDQGIAYITLNRPRVLNAYNIQMRDELYQALAAIRDDPETRVLVLAGAGERAFCAGADLTEFGAAPSRVIARQVRWERDVWGLLLGLPFPTIAALHGYVLGSGIEMALCCDLRVAAEDAVFGLPETTLGMIPAAGATQTLPRIVGEARALDMLLTGQRIDARQALKMGLVHRVVPKARLMEDVQTMAQALLATDSQALRRAKEAVNLGLDLPLASGLDLEARLATPLLGTRQGSQEDGGKSRATT